MAHIHHTSIVEHGAELADDVSVGPFCYVGPNVKIARGTKLKSHVVVEGFTQIGECNTIYPFASVGTYPQDLKYKGEPTLLIIGNNNLIRENVTLQPGTVQGGGKTVIGDSNLFMAYTHVAHDCIIGNENILANCAQLAGHVTIGNQSIISAHSGVHQFCRVGDLGMTAAGSMVVQDLPPFTQVHGNRAVLVGLNVVGLRRKGYSSEFIQKLKDLYKIMFFKGFPTISEAWEHAEQGQLLNDSTLRYFADFIKDSSRGVCRPQLSKGSSSE